MTRIVGLTFAAGLSLVASSAQAFLIDDFRSGPYSVQIQEINQISSARQRGRSINGGYRNVEAEVLANPLRSILRLDIGGGLQVLDTGSRMEARIKLSYDGENSLGLNQDLRELDVFEMYFKSNDRDLRVIAQIISLDAGTTTIDRVIAGGRQNTSFTEVFDFGSAVGGADLSDVDVISFEFFTSPSGDFATTGFEAVPEPATLAALSAGLLAAVARRRRR